MLPERQYVDELSYYPEERPGVHLEVYTNDSPKRRHRRLRKLSSKQKLMICLLVVFSCSLFYVALEAKITQTGYEINQLRAEVDTATEVNQRLMLEVEQLSAPERIAQYAAENEGMTAVGDENILYANDVAAESSTAEENNAAGTAAAGAAKEAAEETESDGGVVSAFSTLLGNLASARAEAAQLAQ